MVYMVHNAKSNYQNADAAGDEKMKRDIVLSEIAKLIVNNPDRVVTHLKESGVNISGRPNRKKLTRMVSETMLNSKKFAEDMAQDIVMARGSANASADATPPPVDIAKTADAAATIVGAMGAIFGGKKKKKDAKGAQSTNNAAANDLATHTNVVNQPNPNVEKSHLVRNIAIGVGVAILITGGIWAYVHFKK